MKTTILFTLFSIFCCLSSIAQEEFSFKLYFEDAAGNKDTITIGYDENATNGIDAAFGEENIITQPWSSGFEVRITDKMPSVLYGEPSSETFRTKKQIIEKRCGESWVYWKNIYIDIKHPQFPVTISWDHSTFQNECIIGSILQNYEENAWFNIGFFDGYLSEGSQIVQNESYLMYDDTDEQTVSSFWLKMGDSTLFTLNNHHLETEDLTISPNPFQDVFTLSSEIPVSTVHLTDLQGKEIKFEQNGNEIRPLNCELGIYFLTLTTEKGNVYTSKIIKN